MRHQRDLAEPVRAVVGFEHSAEYRFALGAVASADSALLESTLMSSIAKPGGGKAA